MTRATLIVALVVIVHFSQLEPFGCPPTEAEVQQERTQSAKPNGNGSYHREWANSVSLVMRYCQHSWDEEWTAPPEQGGSFVREVVGSHRWGKEAR